MGAAGSTTSWQEFRDWRRTRPFWGGVVALLAAIELYSLTAAPFALVVIEGLAGISAIVIGLLIVLLVLVSWFQPQLRVITGVTIVILALATILLTNLGGFLIGMLLGVHGGATIAAWRPAPPKPRPAVPPPPVWTSATSPDVASRPPAPALQDAAPQIAASHPDPQAVRPEPTEDETPTGEIAVITADDVPPGPSGASPAGGTTTSAFAVTLLAAALLVSPGSAASTVGGLPLRPPASAPASAFCDLFPWLCPKPTPTPTPKPAPTPAPAPAPTAAPAPAPAPAPGPAATPAPIPKPAPANPAPAASPTPLPTPAPNPAATPPSSSSPGTATPQPSASPSALPTTTCDPSLVPSGDVTTSSSAATGAASVYQACVVAKTTSAPTSGGSNGSIPLLTPQLTRIVAAKETLRGLSYQGIVTLNTTTGTVRALKFTASSVQIDGIQQSVSTALSRLQLTTSGSSVLLSGSVHLYLTRQKGAVFGLLPLDLSPSFPPPLILPTLVFTNVDSQVAYFDADTLTVPGATLQVS